MRSEVTRLMVEVAVSQGIRDLRSQAHRRALRNLVEHGGRYSRGPFQRKLFSMVQDMLRSDEHPYYELCSRAAQSIDERYLLTFGVNMGFESWTRGARMIRRLEEQNRCDIPWAITVELSDADGRALPMESLLRLIDQGMTMGVMSYFLFDPLMRLDVMRTICDLYPKCALLAFYPDEKLDDSALDQLEGTDNLMLVAVRGEGDFVSPSALRRHKRIYGLCRRYDDASARALMRSGDLRCPGDPDCVMPFFLPEPSCSAQVRAQFNQALMTCKDHPTQPLFPVDLSADLQWIDRIISTDDCALSLRADGAFRIGNPPVPADASFPQQSLSDVIMACLQKDRPRT
jgi:hypothetical protein